MDVVEISFKQLRCKKDIRLSINANFIVLFLLWVMKNVIRICLMPALPQLIWMPSVKGNGFSF